MSPVRQQRLRSLPPFLFQPTRNILRDSRVFTRVLDDGVDDDEPAVGARGGADVGEDGDAVGVGPVVGDHAHEIDRGVVNGFGCEEVVVCS